MPIKTLPKLIQVGLFLNIPVEDHLIISEKSFYSFGDSGLLNDLRINTRYLLPYKVQENMKKEAEKIGEEREKVKANKKFIQIAKQLKNKGFTIKQIRELTGLTTKEITALKPNTKAKPKPKSKAKPKAKP
jgi:DNA repair protein RadC